MNYKLTEKIRCPHCDELWEYPASDYVIPYNPMFPLGADRRSNEQCCHCDKWAAIIKQSNGTVEVEGTDGEDGDYI